MIDTPMMHKDEYVLIQNSLDTTKTMLEWGSGTSTIYFSKFAKHIDSIEHDLSWYNKINNLIRKNNINNVSYHHISWNKPRPAGGVTTYDMFSDYINHVGTINKQYDVVLIDGRARFWCAKKILPYLKKDSVVFIHDFWAYQPHMLHESELIQYNQIFDWYDEIESIKNTEQTIIKLKKK